MIIIVSFTLSLVVLLFLIIPLLVSAISDARENDREWKRAGECLFHGRCPHA